MKGEREREAGREGEQKEREGERERERDYCGNIFAYSVWIGTGDR